LDWSGLNCDYVSSEEEGAEREGGKGREMKGGGMGRREEERDREGKEGER
jgi:hypothetical protein